MLHSRHSGVDGTLRVQRVKDSLDEQGIYPTLDEGVHLLYVGTEELVVGQVAKCRIADVGRHRASLVRRSYGAGYKAWLLLSGKLVGGLPRQPRPLQGHLPGEALYMVVGL